MAGDVPVLLAWALLVFFIALPALAAWGRRRQSRVSSAVAVELAEYAAAVRVAARCLPLDDTLRLRLLRLQLAEAMSLQLAQELERGGPVALADVAQRLATRLRRRVAFERKMLARTAPGLRRGAIAASLPPVLVVILHFAGLDIPAGTQLALLAAEALGCVLLWRVARVDI
jgi:hypothetical protein